MSNQAPAGWYADPANPAIEHYWDGTAYTANRPRAVAPPAIPAPGTVVVPAAPAVATVSPEGVLVPEGVSSKSRLVATLLGFFLGGIGIHRFYLGNIGMGLGLLFAGWLTFGIWPLIDWIFVIAGSAHDSEGRRVVVW